jgi:endogenous inhibitor of DNA gyrase (YacG/DUF329 family)
MQRRCPICKALTDSATNADFPFCSERCRLQDLANWSAEKYVVSGPQWDEGDDEPDESPEHDDITH